MKNMKNMGDMGELIVDVCKCINCGKRYKIAYSIDYPLYESEQSSVFCSEECEIIYWQKQEKKAPKICPECGKEFRKRTVYCSMECYRRHIRPTQVQRVKRACEICGTIFDCSVEELRHPTCSKGCKAISQQRIREKNKN